MPAGSAAALICDTGALIDYLVAGAPDHRLFRNAIDQARTRYVPGLVLAEVDYFLRDERRAMQLFMQDLARGALRTRRRPSVSSHVRWKWTDASRICAWASSMERSWRSPSSRHPSSGDARRASLRRRSTPGRPGVRVGGSSNGSRQVLIRLQERQSTRSLRGWVGGSRERVHVRRPRALGDAGPSREPFNHHMMGRIMNSAVLTLATVLRTPLQRADVRKSVRPRLYPA